MSRKRKTFRMSRKDKLKLLGSLLAAVIFLAGFGTFKFIWEHNITAAHTVDNLTVEQVRNANFVNADKLLILAHPDDDALWAGGHLAEGNWLVVCITNGRNDTRRNEFNRAMNAAGCAHMILEYPDKVNGSRDDWSAVKEGLKKDLNLLLSYKNWDTIATHNPDGEYGHEHHKMTSQLVTEACQTLGLTGRLSYMGKYYSKAKLAKVQDTLTPISDEQLQFKEYLLKFYESQKSTIEKLGHMNPYEMWQTFDEYYADKK
ncbi:MAG: PIG-L family deacetylase [Ruminococcus sp.]|nr:PIG-L family deacetylase [Ruminococcus sp.]